jgi:hypothetical protein
MSRSSRLLVAVLTAALVTVVALPRPAAAATPAAAGGPLSSWAMVTLPLPSRDVAYDATRDVLLVNVLATHPSLGNSLVELDPESGAVGRELWIGTSLGEIAVTDDGSTAYVANGTTVVVVDLVAFEVVDRFEVLPAGPSSITAEDLAVLPGRSDLVVVSLRGDFSPSTYGLRAYVDGVALPDVISGSLSPNRIVTTGASSVFGYSHGPFGLNYQVQVTATGVTSSGPIFGGHAGPITSFSDIEFGLGRVFSTNGHIVDPAGPTLTGSFDAPSSALVALAGDELAVFDGEGDSIRLHDPADGSLVESRPFHGLPVASAVAASGTGFALAGADGLTLLGPAASGSGFVSPPVPASSLHDGLLRTELPFRVNDLVFDPGRGQLYASVATTSPQRPNQLLALHPVTGEVLEELALPGDPGPMAMSEDGSTLHVGLRATGVITSVALDTFGATGSFAIGTYGAPNPLPLVPEDIEVLPGSPDALLVATNQFTALYVGGTRRPLTTSGPTDRRLAVVDATTAWAIAVGHLRRISIGTDGVAVASNHSNWGGGQYADVLFSGGTLYTTALGAIDPAGPAPIGGLDLQGPIAIDASGDRLFTASASTSEGLVEIERSTLRILGTYAQRGAGDPTLLETTGSGSEFGLAMAFQYGPSNGRLLLLSEDPGRFHAIAPARIVDTRTGLGAPAAKLDPHSPLTVDVTGVGGVPDGGASAVVLNLTVVGATWGSHLTVWPTDLGKPPTSNLNFGPGQVVANQVIVPIGIGGRISIANAAGLVHVVVDVQGWFGEDGAGGGSLLHTLPPARVADTRSGLGLPAGRVPGGGTRHVQITGVGGVPSSGVSAVVANLTVVGGTLQSHLTAWPTGTPKPGTSNVNFRAGQVVANQVIVPVGADGRISIANSSGLVHVIVDVQGWFGEEGEDDGLALHTVSPARIADSRSGLGLPAGRFPAGVPRNVLVTSVAEVPPTGASAVIVNLTVTGATIGSHLTAWPAGQPKPATSNVNFGPGQVVANQAIIPVGANGIITIANSAGLVHVIVDIQGWFGPAD